MNRDQAIEFAQIVGPHLRRIESIRLNHHYLNEQIVLDSTGKYQGIGYSDPDDLERFIVENDNDTFEITIWDVDSVINLSDPCRPPNYYKLK